MYGVLLLPDFALQAALRHQPAQARQEPVAVLAADGTRSIIYQSNHVAQTYEVHAGLTSSQSLARCSHLRLLPRSALQEATASEALLACAFSCSPWVETTAEGICTFELRCLGRVDTQIAERAIAQLARLDLRAQAGFAENPDLALLAAHTARPCLQVENSHAFLDPLPLTVLDPPVPTLAILAQWGIQTLGALHALPAEEVARRLGAEGRALWMRAAGQNERLLRLTRTPEHFEEAIEFDYEVETLEPLLFMLRRFIEQLVLRLQTIYRVPARLELILCFEGGQQYHRDFRMPAPTGNVETLFRVVHTHLENFTAPAAIRGFHLSAMPACAPHEQFGLFETALRDPNRFGETLARLHALLGNDRAGVVCLENTHQPDAFHLAPPDFMQLPTQLEAAAELPSFGLPLRRLRPPLSIEVQVHERLPAWIAAGAISGPVRAVRGPFQLLGGWWESSRAWKHEEWDIELVQGGLYRLCHQPKGWFLEGIYD